MQVVINGLYSVETNQTINYDRPIKAVSVDPAFHQAASKRRFVTGDDKVSADVFR